MMKIIGLDETIMQTAQSEPLLANFLQQQKKAVLVGDPLAIKKTVLTYFNSLQQEDNPPELILYLDGTNETSLLTSIHKIARQLYGTNPNTIGYALSSDIATLKNLLQQYAQNEACLIIIHNLTIKGLQEWLNTNYRIIITLSEQEYALIDSYTKLYNYQLRTFNQGPLANSLAQSIKGSIDRLKHHPYADSILELCFYLHTDYIPEEWLSAWVKNSNTYYDEINFQGSLIALENEKLFTRMDKDWRFTSLLKNPILKFQICPNHPSSTILNFVNQQLSWRRIDYKKDLKENFNLRSNHLHEVVKHYPYPSAQKSCLLNSLAYYYYQNQDSLSESAFYFKESLRCMLDCLNVTDNWLNELNNDNETWDNLVSIFNQQFFSDANPSLLFFAQEILHNLGSVYIRENLSVSDSQLELAIHYLQIAEFIQGKLNNQDQALMASDYQNLQMASFNQEYLRVNLHAQYYTKRNLARAYQIRGNMLATRLLIHETLADYDKEQAKRNLHESQCISNEMLTEQSDAFKYFINEPETKPLVKMDMGFTLRLLASLEKDKNTQNQYYQQAENLLTKSVDNYQKLFEDFKNKYKDMAVAKLYLAEHYLFSSISNNNREQLSRSTSVILDAYKDDRQVFADNPSMSRARIYRHLTTIFYHKDHPGLAKFYLILAEREHQYFYQENHFYRKFLQDIAKLINKKINDITISKKINYKKCFLETINSIEETKNVGYQSIANNITNQLQILNEDNLCDINAILVNHFIAKNPKRIEIFCSNLYDSIINKIRIYEQNKTYGHKKSHADITLSTLSELAKILPKGIDVKVSGTGAGIQGVDISGAIQGINDIIKEIKQRERQIETGTILENAEKQAKTLLELIRYIAINYHRQLLKLTPKSLNKLVDWTSASVLNTLAKSEEHSLWVDDVQWFLRGIFQSKERCKLKTLDKKTWSAKGIYQQCGIEIEWHDNPHLYFTRTIKKEDKHLKYDYRYASNQDEAIIREYYQATPNNKVIGETEKKHPHLHKSCTFM